MRQHVTKKRWRSMKWLLSWLFVFLSLSLITHCQSPQVPDRNKSATVALYSDKGTDDGCVQATEKMFEWMGHTVSLVNADWINNKGLDNFSILCIPGGDMYQYSQDISSKGKENIKKTLRDLLKIS